MTSATTKILLISLISFCLVSSAVIDVSQSNGNSANGNTNPGPNSNANSNAFNTNGNKYGLDMTWDQYKTQFSKQYSTPQEDVYRQAIF